VVTDPARSPALRQFYEQRLRWEVCGGEFRCAQLRVPIDYAEPDGATIQIAVVRLPADGPGERVGSLVINPGGPGVSGISYARQARSQITAQVRERYDIVGFDPRGVGESSPVDCLNDRETDEFLSIDGSPDDATEKAELIRSSRSFAQACARRAAALLGHVSTPEVARDLDVLRSALGDQRLYYLGKSYGTLIGARYAELFPGRVGRLVLDGAVDPSVSGDEQNLAQVRGFEQALAAFVADCLRRSLCPLGGTRSQALRQVRGLLGQLDRFPLPTKQPRRLTQTLALYGMALPLYLGKDGWPALIVALRMAYAGDGSLLLHISDAYFDRGPDGRYESNQNEVFYAVNCLDQSMSTTPAEIERSLPRFRAASPTFGQHFAWSNLPCEYWPVRSTATARAVMGPAAPPILVVGTTRDPATPYAWAQGLARQLRSGVLLTYDGDGHLAYARGSRCVDGAVDRYLLRGQAPREGTRCR
jgi:pimeloyl-ACP methyl ester carboxylesterase